MAENTYDCIVVGGGSAGLAFSRMAAKLGARCLLIERGPLGGTCVNRGCVPKKLIWEAAWLRARQEAMGGDAGRPCDYRGLHAAVARKTAALSRAHADKLDEAGVDRLTGAARIGRDLSVRVGGDSYTAPHIVLANGARPSALAIPGAEHLETSDEVLAWTQLPDSAVFLGGGYIGCELASIFAALGVETCLVDPSERVLDTFDPDVASEVAQIFDTRGIPLHLGCTPERVDRSGQGLAVTLDDGTRIEAGRVVAAVGRTPNVDALGEIGGFLETAGSGALAVGPRFETSVPGVHAIGDIADRLPLTPVATRDGDALAHMLFGDGAARIDLDLVAQSAFVMPPVAQVGETDGTTPVCGSDLVSGALVAEGHWTARTFQRIGRTPAGDVRGAALMGEAAADLLTPFAGLLAVGRGARPDAATGIHPTFGEETLGR